MKSLADLEKELPLLQSELDAVTRLVASLNRLSANLQSTTTATVLGNATASDLIDAQRAYDEAATAIPRKQLLTQSVADHKRAIEIARADEKLEFNQKISRDFADARTLYVEQSKALLTTFKEMVRLNNLSLSMRSHQLMFDADWRLDLPAIRREADSELWTVGMMVRDGSIR